MKILLLNGPPRSGKDTAGKLLAKQLDNAVIVKFAEPLKLATHAVMAVLRGDGKVPHAGAYEDVKDLEVADFFDTRPRAAYIQMSESFCKPLFGQQFFGDLMVKRISEAASKGAEFVIITDCGFHQEAARVVQEFGAENVVLIRVMRDGCTFAHDSRGFIDVYGVPLIYVDNDGSLGDLRLEMTRVVNSLTEQPV